MELIVARGQHSKSHSSRRRRRRLFLGELTLLVLAGVAAHHWLWPIVAQRYRVWHQQRALTQAREYTEARDGANASLALQIALRDDSTSPIAWRVAAEILEQTGNTQAVSVRKDILRLPAATADDRLALVLTAIRFGDLATAGDTLRELPAIERNAPAARRAAAQFALASNQPALAHALLDSLRRDQPDDPALAFALAALRLRLPDPAAAQAARTEVETFARQPAFALRAARELTLDALFRRDRAAAPGYAKRLVAAPGATFIDRLTAANVALLLENRAPAAVTAELSPLAIGSAENARHFLSWLLAQGRATDAVTFARALPEAIQRDAAVLNLRAAAVAALGDWHALGDLLRDGAWGPIAPEIVDLALAARTADGRSRPELRRSLWQEAIAGSHRSLAALRILHRLAIRWEWPSERVEVLQAIVSAFPRELAAHESLARELVVMKDTASLQGALHQWLQADPGNRRVKNDWALLVMLREPSNQIDEAKEAAAQLHGADPANPFFVTAHAFALMQLGQIEEALALVEKIPPAERELPARAPYLAAIYAAADRTDDAREILGRLTAAPALPEEVALVKTTRTQIGLSPTASY